MDSIDTCCPRPSGRQAAGCRRPPECQRAFGEHRLAPLLQTGLAGEVAPCGQHRASWSPQRSLACLGGDRTSLALAQSPVVALRTNGSIMRPGDCLRLEALALDYVGGPVSAQVTYRYTAPVVVKNEDGVESVSSRASEVRRPVGPVIDALNRLQLHLTRRHLLFRPGRDARPLQRGGSAAFGSIGVALRDPHDVCAVRGP